MKKEKPERIAVIDRSKCFPAKCGFLCRKVCPGVKMGDETIVEGAEDLPVIDERLCSGCGICVKKCPFDAIRIVNLPSGTGEPLFQYAPNSFRLYGTLTPKEGSVVGIIGVNGIGKTTALALLKGALAPNFGKFGEKPSFEETRHLLKNQDAINYFEKLRSGEARVAYKMQYVDELASSKSTVKDLLKECDEKNAFDSVVRELELEKSLSHRLNELSGGELQRTAIACCVMRKANVYFFDEASSYLDVRQRMLVAKKIRSLAEEGAAVVAVEHDLAVLDYLSDFVHVFYGTKGVYGKISGLKTARNGINEYLDGFLREENVRFRNHAIRFEVRAPTGKKTIPALTYPRMRKHYKNFSLETEEGGVGENEIIGAVGANAIGKTTFVKMLAGVEESDEGTIRFTKKIALKPQYLRSEFGGSVRELIEKTEVDKELLEKQVAQKLGLIELYEKPVGTLSGGELQRLSIGLCLAAEAELRLLDEPSAFLDVEQRLEAAELIKKIADETKTPSFVVDHDVLFIDSVSDKIIVFEGTPGEKGFARAPLPLKEGMHAFLALLGISMRRDKDSGRPRINKPGSALDREQKESGNLYYVE